MERICSSCKKPGHNKRTCPALKTAPEPVPEPENPMDLVFSDCKTCGERIGRHSVEESIKCGMIPEPKTMTFSLFGNVIQCGRSQS